MLESFYALPKLPLTEKASAKFPSWIDFTRTPRAFAMAMNPRSISVKDSPAPFIRTIVMIPFLFPKKLAPTINALDKEAVIRKKESVC